MVVLDSRGMLTTGANQYLQPDYLASPLPTTLDAKKSPLALLAQTCSQIGADTSSTKPLIPPLEKKKVEQPKEEKTEKTDKLAFKPYETKKEEKEEKREVKTPAKSPATTPTTSVASTGTPTTTTTTTTTTEPPAKTIESSERRSAGSSPIIRSGLEILHGHPKDVPLGTYKPACCPPGFEALTNPAFRSPLSSLGASMLYPPPFNAAPNPYMAYARVKTVSGAETLVPVCKDPYCTGCQYSLQNAQLLSAVGVGVCPSGCTQCDHQKLGLQYLPGLPPPPQVSAAAAAAAYSQHSLLSAQTRPYVCNWIVGDTYCGKRFAGSDELLQHLRTHTNLSTSDTGPLTLLNPAAAAAAAAAQHSLLTSQAGLHRTYPNPPLSPLSAARYHPYGKPMPGSPLTATTLSSLIPTHPSLAPYYTSPYSIYGQRLGAAVHP